MLRIHNHIIIICFIIFFCSCNSTEPDNKINLSLVDVSCTEVWLQVTGERGKEIRLIRDDREIQHFTLTTSPMTIFDDSLQINTSYNYQVMRTDNGEKSSIKAVTLDTTSHNYTWQKFEFGDIGSSVLYDCAIISEDNIWCVGDINIADTSENGYTTYNAVHWDGSEWELKRILYEGNIWIIRTVFAFNENDIWFSAFVKYDGHNFIELPISPILMGWSINKIWGTSSSNLYAVGNNGSIAHYNGSQWRKIESGTNLTVQDIYGELNSKTNQYEVICVASEKYNDSGKKIFQISGNEIEEIGSQDLPWSISSIWFLPQRKYYIAGDGMYISQDLSIWEKDNTFPSLYKDKIRGTGYNNIIVSGSNGLVSHFNGTNWHHYTDKELPSFPGRYYGNNLTNNLIVCTGFSSSKAVILTGKK
jgi:hypothetical protein